MRKLFIFRPPLLLATMLLMPVVASAAEIAVTLPPLAGLVSMLDKQVSVMCLLPAGADPHHFQMTPRKVEALKRSELLIRATLDDVGWPLISTHSLSTHSLSTPAKTLKLWPRIDHGWLNPVSVRAALPLIAEALIHLHPERQATIDTALVHALQQTHHIEQAWRTALAEASGIVMQHPSWLHLMQDMHVPVLAVLESIHHGHELGPHKLESALITLKQHPDAWLLGDSAHSNKALDWLARHAKQTPQRITLNALGRCDLSWPELMQINIARIEDRSRP